MRERKKRKKRGEWGVAGGGGVEQDGHLDFHTASELCLRKLSKHGAQRPQKP